MTLEHRPELEDLVGPGSSEERLNYALHYPAGPHPIDHDGPCEIEAEAINWCSRLPGGGTARCARGDCERWTFIPPATCLERIDAEEEATIVVDHATGARAIA